MRFPYLNRFDSSLGRYLKDIVCASKPNNFPVCTVTAWFPSFDLDPANSDYNPVVNNVFFILLLQMNYQNLFNIDDQNRI